MPLLDGGDEINQLLGVILIGRGWCQHHHAVLDGDRSGTGAASHDRRLIGQGKDRAPAGGTAEPNWGRRVAHASGEEVAVRTI